jgi:hypothetical protein
VTAADAPARQRAVNLSHEEIAMKYFIPVLVAVGLAVAPALAIAQDTGSTTTPTNAVVSQPNGPVDSVVKAPSKFPRKVPSRVSTSRGGTDFAVSKADADAKAHAASKLSNKSFNEAKQNQDVKATGGSVKSSIFNKNSVKIGDINNTNYNENKQNVTIGLPTIPVRK